MLPCTVMKSNSYAKGWLLTNAADNKEEEETQHHISTRPFRQWYSIQNLCRGTLAPFKSRSRPHHCRQQKVKHCCDALYCWWHPFSNNLNCWQWVSAFMVAFFATPAQRSFLVNEDRQPLRTNYDVAIYYSSLYWVRSDPWFFLLHHGLVWSSSFHTSIDTTLAELVQALLHQPDGDKWCLTPLEKMIDFPDKLLFARSPLTHVDYAEQRTTMLAHSQSLPSYYATPAEEPLS